MRGDGKLDAVPFLPPPAAIPINSKATGSRLHEYRKTHNRELRLSTSRNSVFHYFINNVNIDQRKSLNA